MIFNKLKYFQNMILRQCTTGHHVPMWLLLLLLLVVVGCCWLLEEHLGLALSLQPQERLETVQTVYDSSRDPTPT